MLLASALTTPLEVLAVVVGVLAYRSALHGFIALTSGHSPREIADATALGLAIAVPTATLAGIAAAVIVVIDR